MCRIVVLVFVFVSLDVAAASSDCSSSSSLRTMHFTAGEYVTGSARKGIRLTVVFALVRSFV